MLTHNLCDVNFRFAKNVHKLGCAAGGNVATCDGNSHRPEQLLFLVSVRRGELFRHLEQILVRPLVDAFVQWQNLFKDFTRKLNRRLGF